MNDLFTTRKTVLAFLAAGALASCSTAKGTIPADLPPAWSEYGAELGAARKPGAAMAAFNRNGSLDIGSWGWADLESKTPAAHDTPFIIGSVSKLVTGIAVMQLVEVGKADLDTDINRWLEKPIRNPRFPDKAITLRMLLTHSSGIKSNWVGSMYGMMKGSDEGMDLDVFVRGYLMDGGKWFKKGNFARFAPGEEFEYSNPGLCLASYIVERISSLSFPEYCREFIFKPLGMEHSSWFLDSSVADTATPYGLFLGRSTRKGYYNAPFYPAAFLKTTAEDFGRFGICMLRGGELDGARIIGEVSLSQMMSVQSGPSPDHWDAQALVWQVRKVEGRTLTGHSGGLTGVASLFFLDIEAGTGALVFTNGSWLPGTGYDRMNEAPMRRVLLLLMDGAASLRD